MSQTEEAKREMANAWFLRLRDPATADWEGFTAWLEADPAHNELYEAVALADGEYGALVEAAVLPQPSNDNPQIERRKLGHFAGWATAAAVTAAAIGYPLFTAAPATYAVETAIGQRQTVRLDDGTRIDLNGGTRITLRKGDNRYASLDRGEAVFSVAHDESNPFTVHVGDDQFQDFGTVFNVVHEEDLVETAVASGAVVYNPDSDAVRVDAGHILRTATDGSSLTLGAIAPTEVASWRDNKLIYKNAPLKKVAADLSRNLGTRVRIAPDIAARPFSGVIMLGGDQAALFPRIAAMLDVTITHEAHGWRLSSRSRDSR